MVSLGIFISKMISPLFEKLEAQFPALKFRKVDVDEQEVRFSSSSDRER